MARTPCIGVEETALNIGAGSDHANVSIQLVVSPGWTVPPRPHCTDYRVKSPPQLSRQFSEERIALDCTGQ